MIAYQKLDIISTYFCWEYFGDLRFHTFMNFILLQFSGCAEETERQSLN